MDVLIAGDPVWYRQVAPGGYGFANDVPAEYVRDTARRTVIRVWMKDGTRKEIAVSPANVRPRDPAAVWK